MLYNVSDYLVLYQGQCEKIERLCLGIVGIPGEMTYSSTSIEIVMIKDVDASVNDDTVTIRKDLSTNDFDIVFVDQNDGRPVTHKATGLYRSRVLEYVYMLLKNQALDNEGYSSVQFSLPAMPRVIVSGSDFKDLYKREHFYELIGTGLDMLENCEKLEKSRMSSFPTCPQAPARVASLPFHTPTTNHTTFNGVARHLFFDE